MTEQKSATASFIFRMLKEAAISVCGLIMGTLAIIFLKEPIEYKIIPAILASVSEGQALYIYPTDSREPMQRYSVHVFPFGKTMVGTFSSKDPVDGVIRHFYINGFSRNDTMFFTYLPTDDSKNGGGTFAGRRDSGQSEFVGTFMGIDKWGSDTECKLHTFAAVLGPFSDYEKFDNLAKNELVKLHSGYVDASVLAPCQQPT